MTGCVVLACQPPAGTAGSQYTVRGGDTLTAIAARFGFASWREIYNDPANEPFRRKRPNPDRIYPGDVLVIPGRPGDPGSLPPAPPAGASFLPYVPLLNPVQQDGAQSQRGVKPKNDQFDIKYWHPGGLKIRLALFWVTNCVHMESAAAPMLARAEELFSRHGLGLDIYPSRHPTPKHTIETPANVVAAGGLMINSASQGHNHYNDVRLEASRRFDDQQVPGKKQRLPVIFCAYAGPKRGLTVLGSPWPPYLLLSGNPTPDRATLAREIVHAALFEPHVPRPKNLMADNYDTREEIWRMQIEMVASAYFTR